MGISTVSVADMIAMLSIFLLTIGVVSSYHHSIRSILFKSIGNSNHCNYNEMMSLTMSLNSNEEPVSISDSLMKRSVQAMKVITSLTASLVTVNIINNKPVIAASVESCNTKLSGYGLPPIIFVPPGFSPLVSEFGRGNIKEEMKNPILVQFAHPQVMLCYSIVMIYIFFYMNIFKFDDMYIGDGDDDVDFNLTLMNLIYLFHVTS